MPHSRDRRRQASIVLLALIFLAGVSLDGEGRADDAWPAPFPGERSDRHRFGRDDFEVDGKPVQVVAPKESAVGRPWVWHGEFFGHKPKPDIALLKRGFHVVHMRVPDMFGSPAAVAYWDALYEELTGKYGFARKAALVGLSRGGLYCYNWAVANPDPRRLGAVFQRTGG
jgi:hypothetical protein